MALLRKRTRHQEWPPPGEAWEHYQQLARELGLAEGKKAPAPPPETLVPQVWDDPELVANFLPETQEHLRPGSEKSWWRRRTSLRKI